ncbi:MAG: hypothetical protein V5B78_13190 [Desulfohalobiaceae bacterium]
MQCAKCRASIDRDEAYSMNNMTFCEDCYLDQVAQPKTCNPWAVYMAKQTGGDKSSLTQLQQRLLDYIQENWPVSRERICSDLGLTDDDFQTNFSVLRHLELARACQVNGEKRFLPFQEEVKEEDQ